LGRTVGIYLYSNLVMPFASQGDRVSHVHTWYDRVGKWGLLFGFFLPGVRHLIGFGAGIAKLPVSVFALLAFAGAFMWSVTFVTAGYFLGRQWTVVFGKIRPTLMTSSIIIVSLFLLYIAGQEFLRQRK
jgi:membrane protein DedA with SNARE-associated domain